MYLLWPSTIFDSRMALNLILAGCQWLARLPRYGFNIKEYLKIYHHHAYLRWSCWLSWLFGYMHFQHNWHACPASCFVDARISMVGIRATLAHGGIQLLPGMPALTSITSFPNLIEINQVGLIRNKLMLVLFVVNRETVNTSIQLGHHSLILHS